jgi:hypothetical protein
MYGHLNKKKRNSKLKMFLYHGISKKDMKNKTKLNKMTKKKRKNQKSLKKSQLTKVNLLKQV